ncbi:hypothetical protein [Sphingomonas abaci]|uniref:Uncharacterized protein n=1 Tax=Sphingomonas abaci TaxID=237611 RepID=A0A7W7AIM4_9SPHN|nr:hypothetical protein [Sphingomonas abaci]MBB4616919.1 hypothetical protein [Sphingomonas abaci]
MAQVSIDVTGSSTAALILSAHTLQTLVHKGILTPDDQMNILNASYQQLADDGQAALKAVYPNFTFS